MRTAIFGGSFNPVHNGHVNLVRETAKKNALDRVFVIPTYVSPFKKNSDVFVADGKDRIEMCRLAFRELLYVTVSDYEIKKGGVSYSVDTVTHFRESFPEDELFFIMGSDMLLSFDRWYRYKDILKMCSLIAASRESEGCDLDELKRKSDELSALGKVIVTGISAFPVSSSEIREKILKNCDISCYMDKNVVKYINSGKIYKD